MESDFSHNRPDWDTYFMKIALATMERSSCLKVLTGAIVVKDKRIISTGYNGAFSGFSNCYENGRCRKERLGIPKHQKNSGACPAIHAEVNALSEISRQQAKGATMYTVLFPCDMCAKEIAHYELARVVSLMPYDEPNSQTEVFSKKREKPLILERFSKPELEKIYWEIVARRRGE